MSKSRRRRSRNLEQVELALLFGRFEHEYGRVYARLAARLRNRYPEITRPGRRTAKALRNIGFFAWSACRDGNQRLIPSLFRAAVLLSAQDDYYDNPRISAAQKQSFCTATNHALRKSSFRRHGHSDQVRDLTSLWSYVAGTIPRNAPHVRSYWIETACQLNDAMAAENRAVRSRTITYEEYMHTAIYSIGMVFVWATYLAHEQVPETKLREVNPILVQGAKVVRWSNDLASYRQHRNKRNAVTLVGHRSPDAHILRIANREAEVFGRRVEGLDVAPRVRGVLLHSMEFLRELYQRSDFDRRSDW